MKHSSTLFKSLYDWRIECTAQQLLDFETALAPVCKDAIRQQTLNKQYNGRFHCALINQTTLLAALQSDTRHDMYGWKRRDTAGELFARALANQNGVMPSNDVPTEHHAACLSLKLRGIVFEHAGHDCLPAEFVLMLKTNKHENDWIFLCYKLPNQLLRQLIPDDIGRIITGKPAHNEMAAWLACNGLRARHQDSLGSILNTADWDLLCYLNTHWAITSVKLLQRFCGDALDAEQLHARLASSCQTAQSNTKSGLQSALEEHFPKRLKKLIYLGLIGVRVKNHNESSGQIILSTEGHERLSPYWDEALNRMADQVKKSWAVSKCTVGLESPWQHDHELWRIWVTLHFMPLRRTQQGRLRKVDVHKMMTVLHLKHDKLLMNSVACLLDSEFITESITGPLPAKIDWSMWGQQQCQRMLSCDWDMLGEHNAAAQLLSELPTEQWLNLDKVTTWLKAKSKQSNPSFPWSNFFSQRSDTRLYHFSRCWHHIYLLPAFHAVFNNDAYLFPSPGWKGSETSAITEGFITPAGDIQLPPEFSHAALKKLTGFCTLTSVEYMVELRLDNNRLLAMKMNKGQLEASKLMLESIQSPLPQALVYQFEKLL